MLYEVITHDQKQRKRGNRFAKIDHAGRGCDTADQNLAFCTDVPETHLERRRETHRDAQEHHDIADGDPDALVCAKRAFDHRCVNLQRVQLCQRVDDYSADDQRKRQTDQTDASYNFV